MSAFAKVPVRMSVAEFLVWDSGDPCRYELVDGEPHAMAPASSVDGFLQAELARLLANHFRAQDRPCDAITNPGVIPHFLSEHNFRVPDIGVTCSPVRPGQATIVDPVLLVEILSPSNQAKTWANVRAYTSIPSVQEILVLRSDRIGAEMLRRLADGGWPDRTTLIADGELDLQSTGFRVQLAALYARTGLVR